MDRFEKYVDYTLGKRLGCHAGREEVIRYHTRRESEELHTEEEAHKSGIQPGLETQGRSNQKSKTGVSVAPQKRTDIFPFF